MNSQVSARAWHTGLSGGAPDSVRCARLVRVNSPLSGLDGGVRLKFTGLSDGAPDCPVSHPRRTRRPREKQRGDVAIIHRTVRWCTGLSGEPTAPAPTVVRAINARHVARSNGRLGAPDYPVCTRQCPVRQPVLRSNGRMRPIWKEIAHRTSYSGCPVATRQMARIAFHVDLQWLLAALGL